MSVLSQAWRSPSGNHRERGLIAIGASLGGMRVLETVLAALPRELPAPVVVVQHLSDQQPSALVEILSRTATMPTQWLEHGAALDAGVVHVARPGHHVVVNERRRAVLLDTPPLNHTRPAADPLFTSAAAYYGPATIAVVLTGRLFDGAAGALAVRHAGGVVIAQDPASCVAPGMPEAAIASGAVHFVLPPPAIARALIALTMVPGARAMFGWNRAA